jgi:hypothetical protein
MEFLLIINSEKLENDIEKKNPWENAGRSFFLLLSDYLNACQGDG